MRQKTFKSGEIRPMYGSIADYVKKEKEEKPSKFLVICPECGVVRSNKRWYWMGDVKESERKEVSYKKCPGCEAIENGWVEGEIVLKSKILSLVPDKVKKIILDCEEDYRHEDPRNRIVKINDKSKLNWKVYTASVFLARMIGERLEREFTSKTSYKFSKGEKYISVTWEDRGNK